MVFIILLVSFCLTFFCVVHFWYKNDLISVYFKHEINVLWHTNIVFPIYYCSSLEIWNRCLIINYYLVDIFGGRWSYLRDLTLGLINIVICYEIKTIFRFIPKLHRKFTNKLVLYGVNKYNPRFETGQLKKPRIIFPLGFRGGQMVSTAYPSPSTAVTYTRTTHNLCVRLGRPQRLRYL